MKTLSLNGQWRMRDITDSEWIASKVPGTVFSDLYREGKIEDPFYRDNEDIVFKMSYNKYEFEREFDVSSELLYCDKVLLCCEGLDTLAEIKINDTPVANTDNMFVTYEFDVKPFLKEGINHIHILFSSPTDYVDEQVRRNPGAGSLLGDVIHNGFFYLRKAQSMFGWDWGPKIPDFGIWRAISIKGFDHGRLEDLQITQKHSEGKAILDVKVNTDVWTRDELCAAITVTSPSGKVFTSSVSVDSSNSSPTLSIEIDDPELWWPNGYGSQPLYTVNAQLKHHHTLLHETEMSIGLRTLKIRREKDIWGESFEFHVNGVSIFGMGADYIIEDNLFERYSKERAEALIKDCVEANFNCLRIWGGGIYPDSYFYDLCDKYGIILWQDFMFACANYPSDEAFIENIKKEITCNVKRLRHHACLGLWCGNNEIEMLSLILTNPQWQALLGTPPMEEAVLSNMKAEYSKIFEDTIPSVLEIYDPTTFYWPSSPSSGGNFDNAMDENRGDVHYWDVWHLNKPFTDYRKHFFRFCSEYGFESFPSMKTIKSFTKPEDRNPFSFIMEKHQKSVGGNGKILTYLSDTYKYPKDFASLTYTSQLLQAEAIRYGVEHWRRNRGRCMGSMYWQLNDCWPTASWSSIDYYGRWKALHYAAKRFYAPVLISVLDEGTKVDIYVTNDTMHSVTGTINWKLRNNKSDILEDGSLEVTIEKLMAKNFLQLDFYEKLSSNAKMNTYLEYDFIVDGSIVSSGTVFFVKPKHFMLEDPKITFIVIDHPEEFVIELTSSSFAKAVELDLRSVDLRFSDNYFDLSAGDVKRISVKKSTLSKAMTCEEFEAELMIFSLYDIEER